MEALWKQAVASYIVSRSLAAGLRPNSGHSAKRVTVQKAANISVAMKISARNQLSGHVTAVTPGAVNGTVKADIGNGMVVTASITEEAIAVLALKAGDAVTVVAASTGIVAALRSKHHSSAIA